MFEKDTDLDQVSWLYWPEEVPEIKGKRKAGRQPYHGQGEVIASNFLDVVEVLSFAGHASISYWDESNDEITTRLYWRQTLNRETLLLSVGLIKYRKMVCESLTSTTENTRTLHMPRYL